MKIKINSHNQAFNQMPSAGGDLAEWLSCERPACFATAANGAAMVN
ncbi:hypothetical protein ACX8XN_02175 [Calditrichota bacterium GD2]